ncbi:hypothetical protein CONPUDRAFT_158119 [Coniophora puteana RWD-64-598 SS2]|uniref:Uncharacterized protein n=1 Tax=Coniophora puteana (strain RWD-64-598) TaxID=741705 RepID=A0A5M3MEH9_CONPW|nr:uncharacterized protein CONPUDRAFT_158119 [Coniophora puteana RWD-64-598 SS2]EIW76981.1 hypothetical protein CONPUDRAFT_158119 [Coniophora puteana RWD-64-598 SS2]
MKAMVADWEALLEQLAGLAITVSNAGPISSELKDSLRGIVMAHSLDHLEEGLNNTLHEVFGYGGEGKLLSQLSSRDDFLMVHETLEKLVRVEAGVKLNSCLPALIPRIETAIGICNRAPRNANRTEKHLHEKIQPVKASVPKKPSAKSVVPRKALRVVTVVHGSESEDGDRDDDELETDDEKTHEKRSLAAQGQRQPKKDKAARRNVLQEALDRQEIKAFGPGFVECCCGVEYGLDTHDQNPSKTASTKKNVNGKNVNTGSKSDQQPIQKREYDLNKYNRHLNSREHLAYIKHGGTKKPAQLGIRSFFLPRAAPAPAESGGSKPDLRAAAPAAEGSDMQESQLTVDLTIACPGRSDGQYALVAEHVVAGEYGGSGAIANHAKAARSLFPYKWDPNEECGPDRNRSTNLTTFTEAEDELLHIELLSLRKWYVEGVGKRRVIRAAQCSQRFVPKCGRIVCDTCQALDKNQSLRRKMRLLVQLERENEQRTQAERDKLESRKLANTSAVLLKNMSKELEEALKNPLVNRAYKKMLNADDHSGVFLHLFQLAQDVSGAEVKSRTDIDRIIREVVDEKLLASQVRVLIGKIPLPGCRPIPLLVLPSQGRETAEQNASTLMECLALCRDAGIKVLSCGSDGAAAEVGSHDILNSSPSAISSISFKLEKYGIEFKIPVFAGTGPLVTIPDPSHVQKVTKGNEETGTHLLVLGDHDLSHNSLVELANVPGSGLRRKDVINADSQDEGAAIRLFHSNALAACTTSNGEIVKEGFAGAYAFHFVAGELFDAFLSRYAGKPSERLRAALRAKFFVHIWSYTTERRSWDLKHGHLAAPFRRNFLSIQNFKSIDALADALIKLALVYRDYYLTAQKVAP